MRDKKLSDAGGAVYLTQPAMRILDRLGLGSRVRSMGLSVTKHEIYRSSGKLLFDFDPSQYGSQIFAVPRPLLRQAFVEALPPNAVSFSTRFIRVESTDPGDLVRVVLRDMHTSEEEELDVECVVGADGCRSQVRKFVARPGLSRPTGIASFRAVVPNDDLDTYPMHTFRDVWSDAGQLGVNGRFGCVRITPREVFWWCAYDSTMGHQPDQASLLGLVLRPYRRKLEEKLKDFPLQAARLVSSTQESSIDWTDVRSMELDFPWVDSRTRRVALVGDAVRQSDLPFFDLGSSLAIVDAYGLAHAISDNRFDGSIRDGGSLFRFEHERREHTREVYAAWKRLDRLGWATNGLSRFFISHALASQFVQQTADSYTSRSLARKEEQQIANDENFIR
jgi:2-polyprenyl-6-methoxyphenol hydroxylase-like FAD-dependent oxidoreductase